MKSKTARTESLQWQEALILWPYADMLEHEDVASAFDLARHARIDLNRGLPPSSSNPSSAGLTDLARL